MSRASENAGRSVKPSNPVTSRPRNWSDDTPFLPDAYHLTLLPSSSSSFARRLPARMICELKPPAKPRSPVTSSSPTVWMFSRSLSSGMSGMLSAASLARRGDHLHRPRDLADVLDRRDAVLDVLLAGHRLGGSACLLALLVARAGVGVGIGVRVAAARSVRRPALADAVGLALLDLVALLVEVGPEVVDGLADRVSQLRLGVVAPVAVGDLLHEVLVLRVQALEHGVEEVVDAVGLDPVEVAAGAGQHGRDLVLDPPGLQLVLVE